MNQPSRDAVLTPEVLHGQVLILERKLECRHIENEKLRERFAAVEAENNALRQEIQKVGSREIAAIRKIEILEHTSSALRKRIDELLADAQQRDRAAQAQVHCLNLQVQDLHRELNADVDRSQVHLPSHDLVPFTPEWREAKRSEWGAGRSAIVRWWIRLNVRLGWA